MDYITPLHTPPSYASLSPSAQQYVKVHFSAAAQELTVNGHILGWQDIDAVEVAKAARQRTLAGWFVRHVLYHEERYHVAIYSGHDEAVLPNVPLEVVKYIVESIAYHIKTPVPYKGLAGIIAVGSND